jgi:hypothetical protein
MNGDNREFVELKQEFRDFKERQLEANNSINQKLISIDNNINELKPLIQAHQGRFDTLCEIQKGNDTRMRNHSNRITRIELGFLGGLLAVAGTVASGIWEHIFPVK